MDKQQPPCPHCGYHPGPDRAPDPGRTPDPGNGRVEDWRSVLGQDFARTTARQRRRGLAVMLVCCVALVPWIAFLAETLPVHYESRQWRLAWVGFDIALLAALAATAWAGWRRRQLIVPFALASAVLLLCDAWFDVMLAWGTDDLRWSLASAVLVELPLAGLLLNRVRVIMRMTLKVYWHRAGLPGDPPPLHRARLFSATVDHHPS
ncbi:hypothetical protein ACFC1R_16360 [Kitasatospora sp. NPDC056138]|uniref:hypothetical protein n=1 Tax=Kitasatospora sp. NPDC056138 TaxID=3345724 RepID=UPI0035D9899D